MGVGPNSDYMSPGYMNNPYIKDDETVIHFIPDVLTRSKTNGKFTYAVKLKRAYRTGLWLYDRFENAEFFGTTPQSQKEDEFYPVLFTPPYFDCGHSEPMDLRGRLAHCGLHATLQPIQPHPEATVRRGVCDRVGAHAARHQPVSASARKPASEPLRGHRAL